MQEDVRHEAVIRRLLDRQVEDRAAREKRLLGYRQILDDGASPESSASGPARRLHRVRSRVPCRITPEARALLDTLAQQFPGADITFPHVRGRRQPVMLTAGRSREPKQIGWLEQCVQSDPGLCNVRDQGLVVETDGGSMLVLRFRYTPTAVRVAARRDPQDDVPAAPRTPRAGDPAQDVDVAPGAATHDVAAPGLLPEPAAEVACVDFSEIRPVLEPRLSLDESVPPVPWATRAELDTLDDIGSRDFDAFYMRFKLEVQAGIWHTLSRLLLDAPVAHARGAAFCTVVREPDVANARISQKTVNDAGRAVRTGLDRVYDAAAATDILLLYLEADILADIADIYFTLHRLAAGAAPLKDDFFSAIRRFWAATPSLSARYDRELAAVIRMAQRAVPAPAQAVLLAQDWTNLRQRLVDRYGEAGRNAAGMNGEDSAHDGSVPDAWPFAAVPAGEVNLGLRVVYRQEWRLVGTRRGAIIGTAPRAAAHEEGVAAGVVPAPGKRMPAGVAAVHEERMATGLALVRTGAAAEEWTDASARETQTPPVLHELVQRAADAAVRALHWQRDVEGGISTGVRAPAPAVGPGLEPECRASSRDLSTRLGDIMERFVRAAGPAPRAAAGPRAVQPASGSPGDMADAIAGEDGTRVYSMLQNVYEMLTQPVEVQNVVLVAEPLPAPAAIDFSWVRRHDWILGSVLLDESFRDALHSISRQASLPVTSVSGPDLHPVHDDAIVDSDTFSGRTVVRADGIGMDGEWRRGYRDRTEARLERFRHELALQAQRERLYDHIRANILHYQRAIWQQEDPHQRSMRYRQSGMDVPLEWRFELESAGPVSIEALRDRLTEKHVAGQFAAYSTGRHARVDELIDPAGPIGFWGNCAVYHMRTEFAAEEAFSMLHFLKSPWLRPDPGMREPEVVDPVRTRLATDPRIAAVSDRLIVQHRDRMFECVPELRLELARARANVRDGTDPGAVDALQRQYDMLRRHFATYLFRRERARRVALDTGRVVMDVIRSAAPSADTGEDVRAGAPAGCELIMESGRASELSGANGHRDAGTDWAIDTGQDGLMPGLRASAGGRPAAAGAAQVDALLAAATGDVRPTSGPGGENVAGGWRAMRHDALRAGPGTAPPHWRVMAARTRGAAISDLVAGAGTPADRERLLDGAGRLLAGAGAAPAAGRAIISSAAGSAAGLLAGAGTAPVDQRVIHAGASGVGQSGLRVGAAPAPVHERAILVSSGSGGTAAMSVGRRSAPEGVILAGGAAGQTRCVPPRAVALQAAGPGGSTAGPVAGAGVVGERLPGPPTAPRGSPPRAPEAAARAPAPAGAGLMAGQAQFVRT